jgi:hypothetical protein
MSKARSIRQAIGAGAVALAALAAATPLRADVAIIKTEIGLPNTVALVIRGGFTGNEILRLKSAIAEIEPGKRIIAILESPGGSVVQGAALGKFFYDAKIPTMVLSGTSCASACTDAFYGGRNPVDGNPLRILVSGAKLGFHNFAATGMPDRAYTKTELENLSQEAQQLVYRNLMHLRYVKAPLDALKLATGTRHEEINYISEGDALEYGIAVLDRQTGKLVMPDNIEKRTRRTRP